MRNKVQLKVSSRTKQTKIVDITWTNAFKGIVVDTTDNTERSYN